MTRVEHDLAPRPIRRRLRFVALSIFFGVSLSAAPAPSHAGALTVRGSVHDPTGQALDGAAVTLHAAFSSAEGAVHRAGGELHPPAEVRVVTGPDGAFRMEVPAAGFWVVVVRAEGHLGAEHPLAPLVAPRELEPVTLPAARPLAVTVVSEDGAPASGAVVAITSESPWDELDRWPGEWEPLRRVAAVDDAGRASFPRTVDEESVVLWAQGTGQWARVPVAEEGPEDEPVRAVLRPGPVGTVRVTTANGSPVSAVALLASTWTGGMMPVGVTGDDGTAGVPLAFGASEEPIHVFADAAGALPALGTIERPGSDGGTPAEAVRIVLTKAPTVSGRVVERSSGAGVDGALVWPDSEHVGDWTDESGRFELAPRIPWAKPILYAVVPGYLSTRVVYGDRPGEGREDLVVRLDLAAVLRGRTVDPSGRPVEGAQIAAIADAAEILLDGAPSLRPATGTSNADGAFRLGPVAAGGTRLLIRAEGYGQRRLDGVVAPEGEDVIDLGDVVLEPESLVSGRVTDESGDPVEGASVWSEQKVGEIGPGVPAAAARTGPDGEFRLGSVEEGELVRVQVRKEGFAPTWVDDVRSPTDEPLRVVLVRSAAVAGEVVDEGGGPVAGAVVRPPPDILLTGGAPFAPTRTDERGAFELVALRPGKVSLIAESPGYAVSAPVSLELQPGQRTESMRIVLRRGADLSGRVVDLEGGPVAGARVEVAAEEDPWSSGRVRSMVTDSDGAFVFEDLATGSKRLIARRTGFAEASEAISLGIEGAVVEMRLDRGGEVSGRLSTAAGEPVPGRQLALGAQEGAAGGPRLEITTEADGTFAFRGVSDGEYSVTVAVNGFDWPAAEGVRVKDGDGVAELDLRLPETTDLTGRLLGLLPDDLDEVEVVAQPAWLTVSERLTAGGLPAEIEPDGGYRISGLAPGSWNVFATAGRSQGRGRVEIGESGGEAVLDLELSTGSTIHGIVLRNGAPVSGAKIRGGGVGGPSESGTAITDPGGRFRIEGVRPENRSLLVSDPASGVLVFYRIEDLDREVVIDLDVHTVRGRVLAADGSGPIDGARITLEQGAARPGEPFGVSPRGETGPDGSFLLSGARSGTAVLRVEKPGFSTSVTPLELTGDVEAASVFLVREPD